MHGLQASIFWPLVTLLYVPTGHGIIRSVAGTKLRKNYWLKRKIEINWQEPVLRYRKRYRKITQICDHKHVWCHASIQSLYYWLQQQFFSYYVFESILPSNASTWQAIDFVLHNISSSRNNILLSFPDAKPLDPLSKKCDIYCNKRYRCINYAEPHKGLQ